MPWNGSDWIYPSMLHRNGIFTYIKSINLGEMEVNLPYMEHQGMHALDGLVFGRIPKLLEDNFDFLMDCFDVLLFEVVKEIVIICDDSILLRPGDFGMCPFNGIWKWLCNENKLKNHGCSKTTSHSFRVKDADAELYMSVINMVPPGGYKFAVGSG